MKKVLLKSVAAVAMLFLTIQFAQGQQKIGHINYAEIFTATPEYVQAESELRGLDSMKTAELQGMFVEFERKRGQAQELAMNRSEANKDSVDNRLQTLGMELEDIERRLEEVQRIAQEELNQKQQELFTPIHQRVGTAIQNVAKEMGYAYILDISSTNIPYFAGGDDVSENVKTKLGI